MFANFVKRTAIAALLIVVFVSTSPRVGLLLCGIVSLGAWVTCGESIPILRVWLGIVVSDSGTDR